MQQMYYGGNIITMRGENDYVEAILVEDGQIIETGLKNELSDEVQNEKEVEKINLKGKTMMPSFIDPHSHVSMVAQTAFMADLSDCSNFEDIVATLTAYKNEKNLAAEEPIIGFGYDHNFLEEYAHPTKDVLDKVSETNPIFIMHTNAHMGSVNSVALALAGIDESTEDPEGGLLGREQDGQEPNGYLEESGLNLVRDTIFDNVEMNFNELIVEAQEQYLENGITTVQDGAANEEIIKLLKESAIEGLLKLDTIAYPLVTANAREIMEKNPEIANQYNNRLKIGGYKMLLDGSPQGKSAWLTEPYEGEETYRGYPWFKDAEVKEFIAMALEDNQQLLVHTNGDAASDQLLEAYTEEYEKSDNKNKANLRPTMIHCQTVRNDQLDQMVELKMIPSIFVDHTYYWGDVHLKNLGEERGNRISPAKSAFDRGLVVNFHQDSPVVKPLMLHTVWAAVNRITRNGVAIGPEERVSVYDALKGVTINAAYAYFEEDIKGTIEEGKLADLVILDENPLEVDPADIKDIQVLETIKEGVTLYKK
jgi:hypothetical protein